MTHPQLRFYAVHIVFLFFFPVFFSGCESIPKQETDANASATTYEFANHAPGVRYVGDAECAVCHNDIFQTYKQTGMGRSFYKPTTENVIEDYTSNNHVYDPASNLHYEMQAKAGNFYQTEYRLNAKGKRIHELTYQVDYIVGSGNQARTYLRVENGFVYEMPVTWFQEKNSWGLSPGYQVENHRFSRPVLEACMNCHNSFSDYTPYSLNHYGKIQEGIGCERCHGPGEKHVDKRFSKVRYDSLQTGERDSSIVNPAHLTAEGQMDVCSQCHLQGKVSVMKADKNEADFRPGMALKEWKTVFVDGQPADDKFQVASHGARMSLSACYTESAGQLTCITCHDPHQPAATFSRAVYNNQCIDCHQIERLSNNFAEADHRATADCIDCHMPQGNTDDVLHVNFTDHWIRKTPLRQAEKQNGKSAAINLKPFWIENDPAAAVRLGIAYLSYYGESGRQQQHLEKAIELLTAGLQKVPDHVNGLYNLGNAYYLSDQPADARPHLQKAADLDKENARAHFLLGQTLHKLDRKDEAAEAYQKALAMMPANSAASTVLGDLQLQSGDKNAALATYRKAVKNQPSYAPGHIGMGEYYAYQKSDIKTARYHLQNALKLAPDDLRALYNLGYLDMMEGKQRRAKSFFERAVRVNPNFAPAYGNLAFIYNSLGETDVAIEYLRKVLAITPDDPQAKSLLKQLESTR